MTKAERREQALDALAKTLREQQLTAREIAKHSKCAIPTAYVYVRALMKRGESVVEITKRSSRTGPRPVTYTIR